MARILIQQTETGCYLKQPGEWVPEREEATDFENSAAARQYCTRHNLRQVRLVMDFGDPRFDVVIVIS